MFTIKVYQEMEHLFSEFTHITLFTVKFKEYVKMFLKFIVSRISLTEMHALI